MKLTINSNNVMKKIVIFIFSIVHLGLYCQSCITIITEKGKLSLEESLKTQWKIVTKQNLSNRGRILFENMDSELEKSKDSIVSYFKITDIVNYEGDAYLKNGKVIKSIKLYSVYLYDTISHGHFVLYIQNKGNQNFDKIKIGDILYLTIFPKTEYDHSNSIGGGYMICLTINNLYIPYYTKSLSIITIPNYEDFFE